MNDLGQLQTIVWTKIKEATRSGDSMSLRSLGQIADEMDRKHEEWRRLLDNGLDPSDTVDDKISPNRSSIVGQSANAPTEEDFSGRSIRGFELAGHKVPIGTYKDLLLEVIQMLQQQDLNRFEAVAPQIRGRGPYFSERPDALRLSRKLPRGKLFVETNMNANLIVTVCHRLAGAFGENLKLDVDPFRTRRQKGTGHKSF